MLAALTSLLQQQTGNRTARIDGLKNGLKSRGRQWFSVDFAGTKKGPEGPDFNDLQNSMELCRS
jgi:hypothetical protein